VPLIALKFYFLTRFEKDFLVMIEVCASTDLACRLDGLTSALDTFWLIFAGSLVFFMQCGFAMLCVGSVRTKNTSNILIQNLLDACGGALGFFCIGFAFAFGDSDSTSGNTFIGGRKYYFLMDMSGTDYVDWFFQFAFAAATATIVAGAVAERCKVSEYCGLLRSPGVCFLTPCYRWLPTCATRPSFLV